MTAKRTRLCVVNDCQDHLRTLTGEGDHFYPLESLYSITRSDAIRLEKILAEAVKKGTAK